MQNIISRRLVLTTFISLQFITTSCPLFSIKIWVYGVEMSLQCSDPHNACSICGDIRQIDAGRSLKASVNMNLEIIRTEATWIE